MVGRNASLPREQWILYRIGVHLGDVIVERDDIYGDGVNIAARLEGLAQPGGPLCLGGVYEQINFRSRACRAEGGDDLGFAMTAHSMSWPARPAFLVLRERGWRGSRLHWSTLAP